MGAGWYAWAIRRDVRALAPTWALCAAAMVAGAITIGPGAGFAAYLLGSMMLGALVIGHEYSHRTLPGLLAAPVPRGQQFSVKLGVLAAMLLALGALAVQSGSTSVQLNWWTYGLTSVEPIQPLLTTLLPPLCALCLGPLCTMLGRSTMAGAVFAFGALSTIWFGGEVAGIAKYGQSPADVPAVDAVRAAVAWYGSLSLCFAAAVAGQYVFKRLQATDGRGLTVSLPGWLTRRRSLTTAVARRRTSTTRHWMTEAVKKEVRLYSLAFVFTGLYVAAWYAIVITRPAMPLYLKLPSSLLTSLHGAFIAVLIGSLASAEERHLGTITWQSLLPVAHWRQWTVKLVVVAGLAAGLGGALPFALVRSVPSLVTPAMDAVPDWQLASVLILTLGSLYVSTLSTSGLRAVVASIAALSAGAGMLNLVAVVMPRVGFSAGFPWLWRAGWFRVFDHHPLVHDAAIRLQLWMFPGFMAAIAVMMLWFAMTNHRTLERHARTMVRQVGWVAMLLIVAGLADGVVRASVSSMRWTNAGALGVRVAGRLVFEGTSAAPDATRLRTYRVSLKTIDHDRREEVPGTVLGDATFVTAPALPDRYFIQPPFMGFRGPWVLKSMTHAGRDVANTPVDVLSNLEGVVITYTDRPGSITGRVVGSGGVMPSQATVYLFPAEGQSGVFILDWANRVRQRSATPDANGTFTLEMPPDGEYCLVAVPTDRVNVKAHRTRQEVTAFYAALARVAERIHAHLGDTITRTLKIMSF